MQQVAKACLPVGKVESLINNRPRKCLGYKTPLEVASAFCRTSTLNVGSEIRDGGGRSEKCFCLFFFLGRLCKILTSNLLIKRYIQIVLSSLSPLLLIAKFKVEGKSVYHLLPLILSHQVHKEYTVPSRTIAEFCNSVTISHPFRFSYSRTGYCD